MKKFFLPFLVILILFCIGAPVLATSLGPAEVEVYNQQDWPVFIGYSAGPNMGFALTDYSGGAENTFISPEYSGTTLDNLIYGYGGIGPYADFTGIGLNPLIAIDLNQSNPGNPDTASYQINYLRVYINNILEYDFSNEVLVQTETGNGKSDFVIPGIDLSTADILRFELSFGNPGGTIGDNTNGKENFFLVNSGATPVPEPATMLLLGSGLVALASYGRKKLKAK